METKELKIEIPEGYEIDESKSSFEKIVFKKKESRLPKSWDDYFYHCPSMKSTAYIKGFAIPPEYCNAFDALNKLIRLRDVYNDGWKPDWKNIEEYKYTIIKIKNDIVLFTNTQTNHLLAFKTERLRDEFYKNFKDLIEQAKELL